MNGPFAEAEQAFRRMLGAALKSEETDRTPNRTRWTSLDVDPK
jgi:hypothetical protein